MNLETPLGKIIIMIDEKIVNYNYAKIKNDDLCLDLSGRYMINIFFEPDGIEHKISCFIQGYNGSSKDSIETGENLELKSFYKNNIKLSIGMEGDTGYIGKDRISDYYDYDNAYLDNGVQYKLLKKTSKKFNNYVFMIAWIENYDNNNEIQTWFGADPTYRWIKTFKF